MSGRRVRALEKTIEQTSSVLSYVGVALLFVLMVQGAADVIGRYLFNKPIMGTMERGQVVLALMVFLGWGYTQLLKGHVNVELFTSYLARRAQAITKFIMTFLVLVFFIFIAWQSVMTALAYQDSGRLIYVIHWPLAPFQLFVTLGAIVLCLVLVMDLAALIPQMKRGD